MTQVLEALQGIRTDMRGLNERVGALERGPFPKDHHAGHPGNSIVPQGRSFPPKAPSPFAQQARGPPRGHATVSPVASPPPVARAAASPEETGIAALARALAAATRQNGHQEDLLGGLEEFDSYGGDRMAKGSAAMASVVSTLEHRPEVILAQFQKKIARWEGCYFGEAWSFVSHADSVWDTVAGHKSCKKCFKILAHLYGLLREYGTEPHVEASCARAYKASVEAVCANASWELAWPVLGFPDPEEKVRPITIPAERVALAAWPRRGSPWRPRARPRRQGRGPAQAARPAPLGRVEPTASAACCGQAPFGAFCRRRTWAGIRRSFFA